MTQHEQGIFGYALNTGNVLPILRLDGKFSEPRLNALANLAKEIPFDMMNVIDTCERLAIQVLPHEIASWMATTAVTSDTFEKYIRKIEEDFAIANAKRVLDASYGKELTIEAIADLAADLASAAFVDTENPKIEKAIEQLEDEQEDFIRAKLEGRTYVGFETGIAPLDHLTNGIQKNHLWVISAATSAGKTTLALNMIHNLLSDGVKVTFYSLEMSRSQIYARLLALESGMGMSEIRTCGVDEYKFACYKEAREKSKEWNLRIYDRKNRLQDIIVSMKEEATRGNQVFVIDYLQNIIMDGAKSEYELLTRSVQEIQHATITMPVSTILVSQISNEDAKAGSLLNIGGKGSGAIKAAADVFAFLRNSLKEDELLKAYKSGEDIPVQLIISKQRHERVGAVDLIRIQATGKMKAY